ncbi:MAG: 2'-5' RNA ligase family protein [Egibacteraceae bacterium]
MAPTAIIVPVPQAAAVVQAWRHWHTTDGAEGMPPHITLLHPFADASASVAEAAKKVLARFAPMDFVLASTARFAGARQVLYLRPVPDAAFRGMTSALVEAFPDHPPYGGAFADVVPHITIADGIDEDVLAEIEGQVRPALPIRARASHAWLMEYRDSVWRLHTRLPFGIA